MTHSEVRNQMPDYLEGDLPLDRRALFDAHLDECSECAREIAEMRWTIGALRTLPEPEAPGQMVDDVMRRIRLGEGQTTLLDRLSALGSALLSPRILAPISVAAIAAGVLLGTEPLRDMIDAGDRTTALQQGASRGMSVGGERPTVVIARSDPRQAAPSASPRGAMNRSAEAFAARAGSMAPPRSANSALAGISTVGERTPGQELIALSELLAERSSRRTRFSDWPAGGVSPSTGAVAPSISVATRPGDGVLGGSALAGRSPRPYLPTMTAEPEQRWPSADEWLEHVERKPVEFADQMAVRTLAEQEHWIDSLARHAVDSGKLDRVVAALRTSRSRTAHVLADDFAAAGVKYGGTRSASSRTE